MQYKSDHKITDWDVAQLLMALVVILAILWYGTTKAEAAVIPEPGPEAEIDLIAASLPIRHVTQAAYDLLLEELDLERDFRMSLEHKLFLQDNRNRVLAYELATAREAWRQAKFQWQFWEDKATGDIR